MKLTIKAALNYHTHKDINVILLDLSLPDCIGLATYRTIKYFYSKIPIEILSGQSHTAIAIEAIAEGAADYLVKVDFDEKILSKTIPYSVERTKILQALNASN